MILKLNQKGSFIIWFTLAFALLGTFVGFAVDFGRAYLEKARIARLVDGAALAAAKVLKGQKDFEDEAMRAACDSMAMNGTKVVMSGNNCISVEGARIQAEIEFFDLPAPGGPPVRAVRVTGNETVPTTFLRFLGWMASGDYSSINVVQRAEAGPERPIDLMLVLDRSGSMGSSGGEDAINDLKITSLKKAVNAFLALQNTFSLNDRIGITSFASRGCGNSDGEDSVDTNPICPPDKEMNFADLSFISQLQSVVSGLCRKGTDCQGGTNTMEALRTARDAIERSSTRPLTRKAVLLVTDGQPTFMRRDSATECTNNPKGSSLPPPGDEGGQAGGCVQGVSAYTSGSTDHFMYRANLDSPEDLTRIPRSVSDPPLYKNVIGCTRSMTGCVTNGAMFEANRIRNCGFNNWSCNSDGEHDVVFFAIGIGQPLTSRPQSSFDNNAKCLLARMANAQEIVNANTGVTETLSGVCGTQIPTIDGDEHKDLNQGWPSCASGTPPCIDPTQEKGKVFIIDPKGNVTNQLEKVFQEIALLLKLRLVL